MQIKTNHISFVFNRGFSSEFQALENVSATFTQGEFVTIIGPTGSGKTTFIEHLNALRLPSQGSVKIGEREIFSKQHKIKNIKSLRKQVGIVFQFAEYQLFEETVEKDIMFGPISMGVNKTQARQLAQKYLKLVGLPESYLKMSPFSLSGGQKRRVALAGILAMEPEVLIFDEPTAGLDPQGEKDMYQIFNKLHKEGKTIIIVTHNLDHVLEYSQRTIVFSKGQIIRDGSSLEIMYDQQFLVANELETPKLVNLVNILKAHKISNLAYPRSIYDLVAALTKGGRHE